MRLIAKLGGLAAVAAFAVAVPAVARPTHPSHSHKCTAHKVSYRVSGTLVSWSLTQGSDGTWSGTFTVHVTNASHGSGATKGSDVTFSSTTGDSNTDVDLSHAKVHFGHNVP